MRNDRLNAISDKRSTSKSTWINRRVETHNVGSKQVLMKYQLKKAVQDRLETRKYIIESYRQQNLRNPFAIFNYDMDPYVPDIKIDAQHPVPVIKSDISIGSNVPKLRKYISRFRDKRLQQKIAEMSVKNQNIKDKFRSTLKTFKQMHASSETNFKRAKDEFDASDKNLRNQFSKQKTQLSNQHNIALQSLLKQHQSQMTDVLREQQKRGHQINEKIEQIQRQKKNILRQSEQNKFWFDQKRQQLELAQQEIDERAMNCQRTSNMIRTTLLKDQQQWQRQKKVIVNDLAIQQSAMEAQISVIRSNLQRSTLIHQQNVANSYQKLRKQQNNLHQINLAEKSQLREQKKQLKKLLSLKKAELQQVQEAYNQILNQLDYQKSNWEKQVEGKLMLIKNEVIALQLKKSQLKNQMHNEMTNWEIQRDKEHKDIMIAKQAIRTQQVNNFRNYTQWSGKYMALMTQMERIRDASVRLQAEKANSDHLNNYRQTLWMSMQKQMQNANRSIQSQRFDLQNRLDQLQIMQGDHESSSTQYQKLHTNLGLHSNTTQFRNNLITKRNAQFTMQTISIPAKIVSFKNLQTEGQSRSRLGLNSKIAQFKNNYKNKTFLTSKMQTVSIPALKGSSKNILKNNLKNTRLKMQTISISAPQRLQSNSKSKVKNVYTQSVDEVADADNARDICQEIRFIKWRQKERNQMRQCFKAPSDAKWTPTTRGVYYSDSQSTWLQIVFKKWQLMLRQQSFPLEKTIWRCPNSVLIAIMDHYKGLKYFGIRTGKFYRGVLHPTRKGFNVRCDHFSQFTDQVRLYEEKANLIKPQLEL